MRPLQNLSHKLKSLKFRPPAGGLEILLIATLLITFSALIRQILHFFLHTISFAEVS